MEFRCTDKGTLWRIQTQPVLGLHSDRGTNTKHTLNTQYSEKSVGYEWRRTGAWWFWM